MPRSPLTAMAHFPVLLAPALAQRRFEKRLPKGYLPVDHFSYLDRGDGRCVDATADRIGLALALGDADAGGDLGLVVGNRGVLGPNRLYLDDGLTVTVGHHARGQTSLLATVQLLEPGDRRVS